jgi:EAL domain-containing protein (putative c-di-GMP-specific phosphodiesterase class I)
MGVDPGEPVATRDELVEALRTGQFFLVYQPTIDLETNGFAGVEALLRWRHPVRGVLNPEAFIAALEDSGAIMPVGRWALQTACSDGAAWHDKGYRFNVSVNISSGQFLHDGFFNDVAAALRDSRFDPTLFVLEFGLSTLTDDQGASAQRLAALRELGVRIAVDDFEPGQSTLEVIQALDVDIVKLNRDFTASLATTSGDASLVHSLVQLSESRHIQVIAAGIEDSDQRATLQNERVQVGQGYLFSHPYEAAEIDTYLEDFSIFSGKPL